MAVLLVAAIQPELLDAAERGLFQQDADVGHVNHPGSVAVDGADGSYVIAGGGENMWFTNDAFHFLWKRVSGDFALQATIQWMTQGGNAHRDRKSVV